MKIAVLISIAKHSQSARLIPSPLDLKACALALDLKQQSGAELDFIHFGKPSSVLDDYLAYGLGKISCYPVADGFQVASICATLKNFDLIISGRVAMSGFASGLFAYCLADALNIPCHSNIIKTTIGDKRLFLEQYLPSGFRRKITLDNLTSPAILSVHEAAAYRLNYNYQALSNGLVETKPALDATSDNSHQVWQTRERKQFRTRLKVRNTLANLSGYERMSKALTIEGKQVGLIQYVSAKQAAQEIWQLLADKKLL